MSLDNEILTRALFELELELRQSKSWVMITEESGVSNVKNIAEGRIKPTLETWQQLHKAFPAKIPPPRLLDGSVIRDESVDPSSMHRLIF